MNHLKRLTTVPVPRNFRLMMVLFLQAAFSTSKGNAQTEGLGTWNILNLQYKHNRYLGMFAEGQLRSLRTYDWFHYHELKGGITFNATDDVRFTLGAGSYQTYREGGDFVLPRNNVEFRLWPQILLIQKAGPFKVEQRYRTEMRWTSQGYRNRFRYRVGLVLPFGENTRGYRPWSLAMNNEIFFTDREPYFERNRVQVAISRKMSKHITLQMGYLHQFDYKINDETGRDFLVVGFNYEWGRKTSTKEDNPIQISDQ